MTAALTSVGVQQVVIAIANGNLTGTAAISAIGSGGFIIQQGLNPSDTANGNDAYSRVEITSSTLITATREATGSSKSVSANASIVDGDTTNFIKSVQSGTVALSTVQTSNTASISAVTNANTALAFLGNSEATSSTSLAQTLTIASLATTVVTVSKNTAATASTTGFCAIEHQGAALNSSVQNIAYSRAAFSGSTDTVAVTSVTTANSLLIYGGYNSNTSANENSTQPYDQLTSSTVFTLTWNTVASATRRNNACLTEYVSGMLAQNIQRGTIALSAATSNTATITSSTSAQTLCNWLNNSSTATTFNPATTLYKITQTNDTTLTMSVNSSATGTGSYEAAQFNPTTTTVIGGGMHTTDSSFVRNYAGVPTIDPGMHAIDDGINLANDNQIRMAA